MVARLVIVIVLAWREHRHEEGRRRTCQVADLGEFTSTDGELWFGEVQELPVSLNTQGEPPTEFHAGQVRSLLEQLPRLVEQSRAYLAANEDCARLEGGAEGFEPCGLDFESDSSFVLEFGHPSDDDGIYRVEFESGQPVRSGRDD